MPLLRAIIRVVWWCVKLQFRIASAIFSGGSSAGGGGLLGGLFGSASAEAKEDPWKVKAREREAARRKDRGEAAQLWAGGLQGRASWTMGPETQKAWREKQRLDASRKSEADKKRLANEAAARMRRGSK